VLTPCGSKESTVVMNVEQAYFKIRNSIWLYGDWPAK
jgi:hypothetical protein